MKHRYTIDIERNGNPGFHPYTVIVTRHNQQVSEQSGKSLPTLMRQAVASIIETENSESD